MTHELPLRTATQKPRLQRFEQITHYLLQRTLGWTFMSDIPGQTRSNANKLPDSNILQDHSTIPELLKDPLITAFSCINSKKPLSISISQQHKHTFYWWGGINIHQQELMC
ncbi:unnamed protein product [Didymodactylos carnosus]|uniref:Uncharacterized protein n=1 Tax=Didymodactylos carnosus TaxID=1234261 RepID=A0A815TNJ0_9BILA|nr:unnamed protein product [Didymodactylos carnosus]CAF1508130.1 unnamed protein product [Didymodactylos carnosus]CAF3764694.1 unnamed protein product [Didymodactylos carnosus]CAF4369114.1 unnamed protein product [Didymodactylos carnosus]